LPPRIAELAGVGLRRWGDELSFDDRPANYYVLANMLGGVYLSQTLAPIQQVSRDAMLDALVAILLHILQPEK
jgi:hypothetical protein